MIVQVGRRGRHRVAPLIAALALLAASASGKAQPAAEPVALVGVTVIDPASAQLPIANQTILIAGGVIRTVGPSATTAIPAGMRRVDARGKYAIPGLWDAHVHLMNTGVTALSLFVANGVTSVREMGGYIDTPTVNPSSDCPYLSEACMSRSSSLAPAILAITAALPMTLSAQNRPKDSSRRSR